MTKKLLLLAAVLAIASCGKTPSPGPDSLKQHPIRIEPLITKVTETDFENGDKIGLTIRKQAASTPYLSNQELTYNGTEFSGNALWYPEGDDLSDLFAYYPHNPQGLPTTFTIPGDQRNGWKNYDFVSSVKTSVKPSANAIQMAFQHRFTKVVVNVRNNTSTPISDILLKNAKMKADISENLVASVSADAAPADVYPFKVSDILFDAVMPPQVVQMTVEVQKGGKAYSQQLVEATLEPGKQYAVNVIVNENSIKVVLSGDIENWGNGGDIPGGGGTEPGNTVEWGGVKYNTVKLADGRTWMAEPLRYIPAGKTPSSDPASDSGMWYPYTSNGTTCTAATDEATIKSNGYLYSIETALGVTLDVNNYKQYEKSQGICPPGWHIPCRQEFIKLVGNSVKGAGESAPIVDNTAAYFDGAYNGAKITAVDAAGFGFAFSGALTRASLSATGAYAKNITSATNAIEAYQGRNAMTFIACSTANNHTMDGENLKNIQFFALMSTFTGNYKEGRLTVAFSNFKNGVQVRCIKDE